MMKSLIYNYLIICLNILNLTFKLYLPKDLLKKLSLFNFDVNQLNISLNKIFKSSNLVFENGNLNILNFTNAIISFYISKKYKCGLLNLIIALFLMESLIIYNKLDGNIIINLFIIILFYIIGLYFRKKEIFRNNPNIREYELYKLY